ncbi:MAG: ATP synthase subunit I [Hyphomicrobiaceae bacterium]
MSYSIVLENAVIACIGAIAGFGLGLMYFEHLRRSVERLASNGPTVRGTIAGASVRLVCALGVFVALMLWSHLAAVGGLVGFSVARRRRLALAQRS